MHRLSRAISAIALLCSFAPTLPAADHDRAPIANAVGRFWGFGYSAGYHARYESRLGWNRYVPDRVASNRYSAGPAVRHDIILPSDVTVHAMQPTSPAQGSHSRADRSETSSILEGGYATAREPGSSNTSVARTGKMPAAALSQPSKSRQPLEKSSPWLRQLLQPEADPPASSNSVPPGDDSSPSDRDDLLVP